MKRYKLLKDLPTFKAGQLAYISKMGNLIAGTPENQETTETGLIIMISHETTLKKFPNILTEWFEEMEEPTDSAHWKPKIAEKYFYINEYGDVEWEVWNDDDVDNRLMAMGLVYRTEEECEEARDRRLAEVRLSQTSDFEPDFENGSGGWVVCYRRRAGKLDYIKTYGCDSGEPVRYATMKEAEKSIKENREDWLIYFGVKE
ncbi:hypothetical protein [Prevotella pallens]|uniref:hypothetical protein n=1 Tax=Prevotella pallens TaxID=60133 RepID=UPI001CB2BFEB|nr:hypothetical protein [Prevotella pallens]MBF1463423.1 hypothetical protein [Prevotella pallens]